MSSPVNPYIPHVETEHRPRSAKSPEFETQTASLSIDGKLLAHIFLDTAIKGTEYEGISPFSSSHFLASLAPILKGRISEAAHKELCKMDPFSTRLLELALLSSTEELSERYAETIRKMKPDEPLLIPFGWTTSNAGHAMLMEISVNRHGEYQVMVFNTGEGISEYHLSELDEKKTRYSPYVCFSNVPKKLILPADTGAWIRSLLILKIQKQPDDFRASAIYEGPLRNLWQYYKVYEQGAMFITPQRSGTCAWKGFLAYLHYKLGSSCYKQLHFHIRLAALAHIVGKPADFNKQMVLGAVDVFAKEVNKKEPQLISLEDAELALELIARAKKLFSLPISVGNTRRQLRSALLNGAEPKVEPNEKLNGIFEARVIQEPEQRDQPTCTPPQFREFPRAEDLVDQLTKLEKLATKYCKKYDAREAGLEMISHFVMQLPLESSFWDRITEKEQTIKALFQLLYCYQQYSVAFEANLAPIELAIAHTLFVHLFEIAKRIRPSFFEGFCANNPWTELAENPFFQVIDADQLVHIDRLSGYLSTETGKKPLFSSLKKLEIESSAERAKSDETEIKLYDQILGQDPELAKHFTGKGRERYPISVFKRLKDDMVAIAVISEGKEENFPENFKWFQRLQRSCLLMNLMYVSIAHSFYQKPKAPPEEIPREIEDPEQKSSKLVVQPTFHLNLRGRQGSALSRIWPSWYSNSEGLGSIRQSANFNRLLTPGQQLREFDCLQKHNKTKLRCFDDLITREIALTGSERALQPLQLLENFHLNPALLKETKHRTYFWLQFFKTCSLKDGPIAQDALRHHFESNPALVDYLAEFVQAGLHYFIDLQPPGTPDVEAALFYIRIATEAVYFLPKNDAFEETLQLCDTSLDELMHNSANSDHHQALVYTHRLHYELMRHTDDSPLEQLVVSWFGMLSFQSDPDKRHLYLEKLLRTRMRPLLTKWESDDTFSWSPLANAVCSQLGLSMRIPKEAIWMKTPGRLHLEYDKWQLNLLTGQLFEEKQKLSRGTPDLELGNPIYNLLFGSQRFTFFSKGGHYYTFDHPKHGQMRILNPKSLSNSIQLYRDGQWHHYIPRDYIPRFTAGSIPFTLSRAPYFHWIRLDKQQFVISTEDDWKTTVATIDQSEPGYLRLGKHFVTAWEEMEYQDLSCLDCSLCIEVYHRSSDHILEKLVLPRCFSIDGKVLTFHKTSEGICWGGDNRYFLDQEKPSHFLPIDQYITLTERTTKKQKVLIIAEALDPKQSRPFSTEAALLQAENYRALQVEKRIYLEFDFENEQMIPQNTAGVIFLAYLRIHERKFEEAHMLLERISQIDALSALDFRLLDFITAYPSLHQHNAPIPIALALKAFSIALSKQLQTDLEWTSGGHTQLYEFYTRYLNMESSVPHALTLPREVEKMLITFFRRVTKSETLFSQRAAALSLKSSERREDSERSVSLAPPFQIHDYYNITHNIYLPPFTELIEKELKKEPFDFEKHLKEVNSVNSSLVFWKCWEYALKGTKEQKAWVECFANNQIGYQKTSGISSDSWFLVLYAIHYSDKLPGPMFPPVSESYWESSQSRLWLQKDVIKPFSRKAIKPPQMQPIRIGIDRQSEIKRRPPPTREQPNLNACIEDTDKFFTGALQYFVEATPVRISDNPLPSGLEEITFPEEYSQAVNKEMALVQDDYELGTRQLKEKTYYTLEDPPALIEQFETKRGQLDREISELEVEVLEKANQLPADRAARAHRELELSSGKIKLLTIWDLEKLFLSKDKKLFLEANPALNPSEIYKLMGKWEILQINMRRVCQAQEWAVKIQACNTTHEHVEMRKLYCGKIIEILKINLNDFSDEQRSNYLVFTRASQKHPRVDQRESLSKLSPIAKNPCILARTMGSGKTAVIAPLWAWRTAQMGKLPVFCVDSSQYSTVANALKTSQRTCFGQKVFTIQYSREQLSNERLGWILGELEESLAQKKLLIICPEMVQLFDLERSITARSLKISDKHMNTRLRRLNKILEIFKSRAAALGDEIDSLLRSDKEVTLPIGETLQIIPEKVALTRTIFEILCSKELKIDGKSLYDYLALQQKEQTHLNEEDWKRITPVVARHLAETSRLLKLKDNRELHEAFVKFVCNEPINPSEDFWIRVEQLHASEDSADKMAAELICLVKHLFQDLLPLAFRQTGGRNFGRFKPQPGRRETPGMVIPYLAADTPGQTEFAYHYEALVKHLMLAVQEGVEASQVLHVAEKFESLAHAQMQISDEKFHDTAEAKLFKKLTGVDLIDVRDPVKLTQATATVNTSLDNRLAFEAETANIYATYHAARLSSTAQSFVSLFGEISGMTGTDWNHESYPPNLADNVLPDTGSQGRILKCMMERKTETTSVTLDPADLTKELESFYDRDENRFADGIFDAAALFSKRGLTNREIATHILTFLQTHRCKQRAVLFFDKPEGSTQANQFTALILNDDAVDYKPIEDTSALELRKVGLHSPEQYVVFLPERQTTGTDIPMSLLAKAYMTFDETMTLRSLLQTTMRLRDFLNRQRIHFILSPTLKQQIPEGMNVVDFIIRTAIVNEARSKADSQLRAYKQMINEVFKIQYREHLTARNTGELLTITSVYDDLIFPKNGDDLYRQCFGNAERITTFESLKIYANQMLKRFRQALKNHHPNAPQGDFDIIKDNIEAILKRARRYQNGFVTFVQQIKDKRVDAHADLQAEMLQQRETQLETTQKAEHEMSKEMEKNLSLLQRQKAASGRDEIEWYNDTDAIAKIVECFPDKYTKTLKESIEKTRTDCGRYYSRFAQIFTSKISATHNFLLATKELLPLFHSHYRPASQILAFQRADDTFAFLLLSVREAKAIAEQLQQAYKKQNLLNVWLMTPSTKLYASNPEPLPLENSSLRHGLVELNFFAGRITPLQSLKLMTEAEMWLEGGQATAKKDFLIMRFQEHFEERSRLYKSSLLTTSSTQPRSIVTVARAELLNAQIINPAEIQAVTDEKTIFRFNERQVPHVLPAQVAHVKPALIRFLVTKDQIQAVPPDRIAKLSRQQMNCVSVEQAPFVEATACIRNIPIETLKSIEIMPRENWIHNLSGAQVAAIPSRDWVASVHPELLYALPENLLEAVTPQMLNGVSKEGLNKLPDTLLEKVPARLKDLLDDRIGQINTPALVPHIQRVDALSPSLAQYIPDDQLALLTNEDIIAQLPDEKLHYLSPSAIPRKRINAVTDTNVAIALYERDNNLVDFMQPALIFALHQAGKPVADFIKKSEDKEWCELLPADQCEELLNERLIPRLSLDKVKALGRKFRHLSKVQLNQLLDESFDFRDKPIKDVQLKSDHINTLSPQSARRLLTVRPDQLPNCNDPELFPLLSPDERANVDSKMLYQMSKAEHFALITPDQLRKINPNHAHNLTAEQHKQLTKEQIRSISSEEALQSLTEEQLPFIDPQVVPKLARAQFAQLPPQFICDLAEAAALQALPDEQLAHINPNLAYRLTPQQYKALKPQQIWAIDSREALRAIPDTQLPHINPNYLYHLTHTHKLRLRPAQIGQIDSPLTFQFLFDIHLAHINVNQAHNLSVEQRRQLTPAQIGQIDAQEALQALPNAQLAHINVNLAHRLTVEQRDRLSQQQIGQIDAQEALQALSNAQLAHINVNLAHRLTVEQRDHLSQQQIGQIDAQEALQALSNAQLAHINVNLAYRLTVEQRDRLSQQQIGQIDAQEALQALSNAQLVHVNVNLAHRLTDEQRDRLSQQQIGQIDAQEALQVLTDAQLAHINVNQAHNLSNAQRRQLTPAQIGLINVQEALQALTNAQLIHTKPNTLPLLGPEQRQKIQILGCHANSRNLKITLIAVSSLGGVALIFGALMFAGSTSWSQVIVHKLSQGAIIGITASGGGLIIICLTIEASRRRKLSKLEKLD